MKTNLWASEIMGIIKVTAGLAFEDGDTISVLANNLNSGVRVNCLNVTFSPLGSCFS